MNQRSTDLLVSNSSPATSPPSLLLPELSFAVDAVTHTFRGSITYTPCSPIVLRRISLRLFPTFRRYREECNELYTMPQTVGIEYVPR